MVVVRFAIADLLRRWRVTLPLGILVSIPLFAVTLVDGYVRGLHQTLNSGVPRLVVQQQGSVGQILGSRIPASVEADLRALGVTDAVAEIHTAVGSSGAEATFIVGVDPRRYQDVDHYRLLEGRHLRDGDGERTVVLGHYLAARLDAAVGDLIPIRGRDARVVGIVETGIYLDDAALLTLADARQLLGWGDEVSLFVIPEGGPLHAGDVLSGGLEVVARGDVGFVSSWDPVIGLMTLIVRLLAVGALAVLAMAVWRLVWLERVDLGVLRLLGFRTRAVAGYVALQCALLVVVSAAAGVLGAITLGPRLSRTTLAVTSRPVIDRVVLARSALTALVVLAVAVAVPAVVVGRLRVRALLVRDD